MEELQPPFLSFELSKEFMERFQSAIDERDRELIIGTLEGVDPNDISELLYEFNTEDSKYVIELLDREVAAEILAELDEDIRDRFLKNFDPEKLATYIEELDSDDAADVLSELPTKEREEVIASITNEEKAQNIEDLLRYEEDVAGGLMAKEMIKANLNWTIKQCIEEIRRQKENVEKIYSIYVVDNQERLLGRVSLKRLILSNDDTLVADIYEKDLVSVETYQPEEEVAAVMQKYDLEAVPVVNFKGKLAGRITIDDVVDVITEQAEEERQIMSGISEDVEEDDSIWMLTRARLPWLVIGMAGGLLGAQFIGLFEENISLIPAMAFFIPLITATGGNVGIQSSSIVVQTIASRSFISETIWRRLFKVLLVAVLNGLALAAIVFGANLMLGEDIQLAMVVAIALFSVVLLASFMGTVTPILLDKAGINPALASGPFITTANDLLGLAVYFTIAHFLYNF